MNIVIPMAGAGSRFKQVGWNVPKPIIDVFGKPMIAWAVDTLGIKGKYIFIVRLEQVEEGLEAFLRDMYPSCEVIVVDHVTEGAACSCLLAKEFINNDKELLIANCDQVMVWEPSRFISTITNSDYDGVVVTYPSDTNKNSYIALGDFGYGVRLAEKEVISEHSLNGIHYWKRGSDFVRSAEAMIKADDRVNGEFYISITYNYLIKEGKKIGIHEISKTSHHAIGTPNDLILFMLYYVNGKI